MRSDLSVTDSVCACMAPGNARHRTVHRSSRFMKPPERVFRSGESISCWVSDYCRSFSEPPAQPAYAPAFGSETLYLTKWTGETPVLHSCRTRGSVLFVDEQALRREQARWPKKQNRWCDTQPSSGNWTTASQPFPSARLVSETLPPCASAICRLKARPMPDPLGLVVKKGTNKFDGLAIPGPSSCTNRCSHVPFLDQPTLTFPAFSSDASTALRIKLISSCWSWSGSACSVTSGPGSMSTAARLSKPTATRTSVLISVGRSCGLGNRVRRE